MLKDFRADIDRYVVLKKRFWLLLVLTEQGLWALSEYRFNSWRHNHVRLPLIRHFLYLICVIWHKLIETITGISIPYKAKIGKGLYIGHFGGIFINEGAVIGENCNLSQGVTIGLGGRGDAMGCPKIGDRVFIGPGAKIFGAITIGNDVAIGANAVVTKNLPDEAVAVGIPAKVVNLNGSKDYIILRD
jgi:serine O-acetyltransferase